MFAVCRENIEVPFDATRYQDTIGVVPRSELAVINGIVQSQRLPTCRLLELGTGSGNMVVQFSDMLPNIEVWSVNILPEEAECRLCEDELFPLDKIGSLARANGVSYRQILGDTRKLDFEPWGAFDIIFIDACHAYEWVLSDSRKSLKSLKPGGILIWHDFGNHNVPDVQRAVEEFDRSELCGQVMHVANTTVAYFVKP